MDFFFAEKYCLYRNITAVIGLLWVSVLVIKELRDFIRGIRAYFLAPLLGVGRIDFKKYGPWAVVTGASEGIGRGYALELARQGLNVVLMSRSREKLQKVADEIKDQYERDTLIIPVDFSSGYEIYGGLASQLQGLDIGILVNNVGMFYKYPDIISNIHTERLFSVTEVNTQSVVQMSRLLLPEMVKLKRGIIINISSASSIEVVPQMTVYSATKIFVKYISDGIRKEYGASGIIVQTVVPYLVTTAMSGIKKKSFFIPDWLSFSRSALSTVGIQDTTFGCFSHAIQGYFGTRVPSFLADHIGWKLTNNGKQRYLRRMAKSK